MFVLSLLRTTEEMPLCRRLLACGRVKDREKIFNEPPWIRLGFFLSTFLVSAQNSLAQEAFFPSFLVVDFYRG